VTQDLDIQHLQQWIGRSEEAADHVTPALIGRFRAALGLGGSAPEAGAPAPRLIHFCLCQPAAAMTDLGRDGHPARGGFLPDVPLPRRMWASSDIRFSGDIRIGEAVTRRSTVADVQLKQGRTGPLCFVTVEHEVAGEGGGLVKDRQTLVYRSDEAKAPAQSAEPAPQGSATGAVMPTPTLLFRYSALTFNGHRIHYDHDYARDVEGYPGLVVHGPLQATLLFHFAASLRNGREPSSFRFRSLSPLFDGQEFALHAEERPGAELKLWTALPGGPYAMWAEAGWD